MLIYCVVTLFNQIFTNMELFGNQSDAEQYQQRLIKDHSTLRFNPILRQDELVFNDKYDILLLSRKTKIIF